MLYLQVLYELISLKAKYWALYTILLCHLLNWKPLILIDQRHEILKSWLMKQSTTISISAQTDRKVMEGSSLIISEVKILENSSFKSLDIFNSFSAIFNPGPAEPGYTLPLRTM